MSNIQLYNSDCLEEMKNIKDGSVDMILCDLPYGTTRAKWDSIIPLEELWGGYKRIIKERGAIVLFGSEPFTSTLINSQKNLFKYDLVWVKNKHSNCLNAGRMPLKIHENICVFYKKLPVYNKQWWFSTPYCDKRPHNQASSSLYGNAKPYISKSLDGRRNPQSVLYVKKDGNLHPTQKPVELLEWLIETYTNEGEVVLDNCMGSGSTGVACVNTDRDFIGIEKDAHFFEIAKNRIEIAQKSYMGTLF